MKILADFHHSELARSLQIVLVERLGHQLYFPYGMEWFDKGYWLIGKPYGAEAWRTATQFLKGSIPQDGTGKVTVPNQLTFEEFLKTPIDAMIATYIDHNQTYHELIGRYKPGCKLITQIGNEWLIDYSVTKNLMASTSPFNVPSGVNAVFYHQEFPLPGYQEPSRNMAFYSFVNCLQHAEGFKQDWQDFLELEKHLPNCKSFGSGCRDGNITGKQNIYNLMKESRYGIHLKSGGDGYGHIIHNWYAAGRPVIYRGSQYQGKIAGKLLVDGQTGWDLDKHSFDELSHIILQQSYLDYADMCSRAYNIFMSQVDFQQDVTAISQFLSRLI